MSKLFQQERFYTPIGVGDSFTTDRDMGFARGGMPARGAGGDIGRVIGDWIQSSLGFRRGGRAMKARALGGDMDDGSPKSVKDSLGRLGSAVKKLIGIKRGGKARRMKK